MPILYTIESTCVIVVSLQTHVDVVHFRKTDNRRLRGGDTSDACTNKEPVAVAFDEERLAILQELSTKPDVYERLARAIAPSIYENEDIKKGILLQVNIVMLLIILFFK